MKKVYILLVFIIAILQGQTKTIAVLEFDSEGVSKTETNTLTNRLRNELFKMDVYNVLERGKMEEVLKEQGFLQTGCTTSECAVQVGNLLGVELMLAGSIGKVGNVYTVSARIIDVKTGELVKSADYDHIGEIGFLLLEGMKNVANQLIDMKPIMRKSKATQLIDMKPIMRKSKATQLNQYDANPNIKKNITPQKTNKIFKKNNPKIDYSSNKQKLFYSFCCVLIFSLIAESTGL